MVLVGNPVSKGIVIGKCYLYEPFIPHVQQKKIGEDEILSERTRFDLAKQAATIELMKTQQTVGSDNGMESKIFVAHIDILNDIAITEEILEMISDELMTLEWSIEFVFEKYRKILMKSKDAVIAERAGDLLDVKNRLLRILANKSESNLSQLEQPVIVLAHDLLPSDTATLDRKNVLGIVTETGGSTSHSAIIARSYEIPAVLGVGGALNTIRHGSNLILDANEGKIIVDPSPSQCNEYFKKRNEFASQLKIEQEYLNKQCKTRDGYIIDVGLNIGSFADEGLEHADSSNFIGLMRTEFLYMDSLNFPSEEEQYDAYKKVLDKSKGKILTLRTLDIGGDKTLPYWDLPREENPFLGLRALRLCFKYEDLFLTQIRAALRATAHGEVWIMLPMVSCIDDIYKSKAYIEQARKDLIDQGCFVGNNYKVGIMIEVPSIALMSKEVAEICDFASIGTNDLCQYTFAVDRMNASVSNYYKSTSAPMLRLMKHIVDCFSEAKKPLCVCGEMAGEDVAAISLVGIGVRKISMSFGNIARIKYIFSHIDIDSAERFANAIINSKTTAECEKTINDFKQQNPTIFYCEEE